VHAYGTKVHIDPQNKGLYGQPRLKYCG